MNYKTIIINGIEYEMHPHINDDEDCKLCCLRGTKNCPDLFICVDEDCYFISKEL